MSITNVSAAFSYKGKVYAGLSLMPGVGIDLVRDPFGSGRLLLTFPFCSEYPQGIFWDTTSAIELGDDPAQGYLVLEPDAV